MALRCRECDFVSEDGLSFCGQCGVRLPVPEPVASQAETRVCSHCQAEMPAHARFCGECGRAMHEATPQYAPTLERPSGEAMSEGHPAEQEVVVAKRRTRDLTDPAPTGFLVPRGDVPALHPAAQNDSPGQSLRKMVRLAGGWFSMGSRADCGHRNEHPQHKVTLSPFYIDCCAVSNIEYERFDPNHRRKRSDTNSGDCDPVVYVTPQDALNYCRWRAEREGAPPDAYSLPSEAQWEYCSRAGEIDKEYPWGDQYELHHCHTLDSSAGIACAVDAGTPSPYGLYQLPGNVREWCVDYYAEDAYARQNAQPTDPTGPRPLLLVNMQVVRGASYRDRGDAMARCAARDCAHPHSSSDDIGFRCVRSAAR